MKKKVLFRIIIIIAIALALMIGLFSLFTQKSDMMNVTLIEVLQSGDSYLYEITDKKIIQQIVGEITGDGKTYFDWSSSESLPEVALYLYTDNTMYGAPLLLSNLGNLPVQR